MKRKAGRTVKLRDRVLSELSAREDFFRRQAESVCRNFFLRQRG